MNPSVQTRRRLPHIYQQDQPIFLTWRLRFSLPHDTLVRLAQLKKEYDEQVSKLSGEYRKMQSYLNHKRLFGWLDEQFGRIDAPILRLDTKPLAYIISDILMRDHEKLYMLCAYCVMPNHVHVLFTPFAEQSDISVSASGIIKTWKGASSRLINQSLGRTGSLWETECYDHYARSEEEKNRIIQYIIDNPAKAGLVNSWSDWPYTWLEPKTYGYLNARPQTG